MTHQYVRAVGRIYSVGYEGLTVAGLIERLQQSRVEELVDVRASPYSRRPGFSKKRLAESLSAAGITYRHEPLLGNAFRDVEDFGAAMDLMRDHLATGEPADAVDRLIASAEGRRIAILCLAPLPPPGRAGSGARPGAGARRPPASLGAFTESSA